VEPTLVAVWEAMAAAAADEAEAADAFEHAAGLGGGVESWMGFAAGEQLRGVFDWGRRAPG
jgi:hypothetical protein